MIKDDAVTLQVRAMGTSRIIMVVMIIIIFVHLWRGQKMLFLRKERERKREKKAAEQVCMYVSI